MTDTVWVSTDAMLAGMVKWASENPTGVIASWFKADLAIMQRAFSIENAAAKIALTSSLTPEQVRGRKLLLMGHYPLAATEAALAENLGLKKLFVYAALDSPLFKRFGGDRIIEVIRTMGMKEDEGIEHSLVTSAIKKAQGKIAEKTSVERTANSEEEWMLLNLGETY